MSLARPGSAEHFRTFQAEPRARPCASPAYPQRLYPQFWQMWHPS